MDRIPTLAAVVGLFVSGISGAQTVPSEAGAGVLPDGPLRIIITAVSGKVAARQGEDDDWAEVQVGQNFDEGVEIRTGPRSAVKFDIPPASSVTLDRLGIVKVVRASIENGAIKTDLGMKYGRTRFDIEAAGREHDAKIRSASSVLAVRGTDVILDDTPGFAPRAASVTGRARYTDSSGNTVPIGSTDAARPSRIEGDAISVADTSLAQSIAQSPLDLGRTTTETALIVNIPQAAGLPPPPPGASGTQVLLASSQQVGNPLPPNLPAPIPDNQIPGRLEFVLGWTGNADLQIGVLSPLGEPITTNPATAPPPRGATIAPTTSAPSGGMASADAIGGPSGTFIESVTWANSFPPGTYEYGVRYNTGQGTVSYSLDVLVNGVRLDPPVNGTLTGPTPDFTGPSIEILPVNSATQNLPTGSVQPSGIAPAGVKKKRK